MKYTLKNRLIVSFIIGFCFIVFNIIGFTADRGGIQQKERSELENPEIGYKHEKDSFSNQSLH